MKLGGATGGFFQLISANVVTKIVGLVAFGVFTRFLTKEDLAFLPIYAMLTTLSYVFFGFGLQPTIIRQLPGMLETDRPAAGRLIRMSTRLLFAGPLVFALCVFLGANLIATMLLDSLAHAPLIRLTAVGSCFFAWIKSVDPKRNASAFSGASDSSKSSRPSRPSINSAPASAAKRPSPVQSINTLPAIASRPLLDSVMQCVSWRPLLAGSLRTSPSILSPWVQRTMLRIIKRHRWHHNPMCVFSLM